MFFRIYRFAADLTCGSKKLKMVDEATKKTLAAIPLLKTKAGPRDKDSWVVRLKEEYSSLIKVSLNDF
jgi:hypothetical protein